MSIDVPVTEPTLPSPKKRRKSNSPTAGPLGPDKWSYWDLNPDWAAIGENLLSLILTHTIINARIVGNRRNIWNRATR